MFPYGEEGEKGERIFADHRNFFKHPLEGFIQVDANREGGSITHVQGSNSKACAANLTAKRFYSESSIQGEARTLLC